MHKKRRDYSMIKFELHEMWEQGERKRVNGKVEINYSVFKKTPEERQRLKTEKSRAKEVNHCRPCKRKRLHEFLKRKAESNIEPALNKPV